MAARAARMRPSRSIVGYSVLRRSARGFVVLGHCSVDGIPPRIALFHFFMIVRQCGMHRARRIGPCLCAGLFFLFHFNFDL
ncbi:hypothetical protein KDW41_27490 [Burkholderia vietnamiensis]|nr:hypothetical protein [Burkholderia vietnamiensis]